MIYALSILTLLSVFVIMREFKVYRLIIYTGIFSAFVALIYLVLGGPDVAMAEGAVGVYSTLFLIIAAEKYYRLTKKDLKSGIDYSRKVEVDKDTVITTNKFSIVVAVILVGGLGFLFYNFIPNVDANPYLRNQFLERAAWEVGGLNNIGAILMSYRLYDTLFEALLLVVAIMAVSHLSFFDGVYLTRGQKSEILNNPIAFYSIRILSPLILLFGIYLIINGHLGPGGGFQGGLAVAGFFICRYFIHDIYDLNVKKVLQLEEIVFMALVAVGIITVFLDITAHIPFLDETSWVVQHGKLIAANALVGIKVACGFFILFYRYITIERN